MGIPRLALNDSETAALQRRYWGYADIDGWGPKAALLTPRKSSAPNHVASSVLREAVAEGPILFHDLDKVHEHVFRPDAGTFAE